MLEFQRRISPELQNNTQLPTNLQFNIYVETYRLNFDSFLTSIKYLERLNWNSFFQWVLSSLYEFDVCSKPQCLDFTKDQ
jgi:hypothetical protein